MILVPILMLAYYHNANASEEQFECYPVGFLQAIKEKQSIELSRQKVKVHNDAVHLTSDIIRGFIHYQCAAHGQVTIQGQLLECK